MPKYVPTKNNGKYGRALAGDSPIEPHAEVSRWSDSSTADSDVDDSGPEGAARVSARSVRSVPEERPGSSSGYFLQSEEERLNGWRKFFKGKPLMRCLDTAADDSAATQNQLYDRLINEVQRESQLYARGALDAFVFWKDVRENLKDEDVEKVDQNTSNPEDDEDEDEDEDDDDDLDQKRDFPISSVCPKGTKGTKVARRQFGDEAELRQLRKELMGSLVERTSGYL